MRPRPDRHFLDSAYAAILPLGLLLLVPLHFLNPPESRADPGVPDLAIKKRAIMERERALHEEYESLRASSAYRSAIASRTGGAPSSASGSPDRAAELSGALKAFQANYDQLALEKIDYLLELQLLSAKRLVSLFHDESADPASPWRSTARRRTRFKTMLARADRLGDAITAQFEAYRAQRSQWGQPKDAITRLAAHWKFYDSLQELFDLTASAFQPDTRRSHACGRWIRQAVGAFRQALLVARLLPGVIRFAYELYLRPRSRPGQTPLSNAYDGLFQDLRRAAGIETEIIGKEHLDRVKAETDPGVINFFTLQHVDGIYDRIAISELGIRQLAAYSAAGAWEWMNDSILRRMNESNDLIVVGRGGSDPMGKLVRIVQEHSVRNLLSFWEGSTPAGIMDTRPVREKSYKVIETLQELGFKVRIIPVSLPDNYRLLNERVSLTDPRQPKLRVIVSEPIEPVQVAAALRMGAQEQDPQILARVVRAHWLENMPNDGSRVAGVPDLVELEAGIRSKLWRNQPPASCIASRLDDLIEGLRFGD